MRNDQDKTRVLLLLVVRQQEQKVLRVFLITRTLIGICTLTLTAASNSQSLPSGFL